MIDVLEPAVLIAAIFASGFVFGYYAVALWYAVDDVCEAVIDLWHVIRGDAW